MGKSFYWKFPQEIVDMLGGTIEEDFINEGRGKRILSYS